MLWFRNYAGLQSVRAVEHVHVLLRGVDGSLLRRVVESSEPDGGVSEGEGEVALMG